MGRPTVKVTVDTNVLVRAAVLDDPDQGAIAAALLTEAELLAVTLPALCELCWVLKTIYQFPPERVAQAVRDLMDAQNVAMDRETVEAGLAILSAGGDFADGVIAHDGHWLGGEAFVSFDQKAVRLLKARGEKARIPG